MNIFIVAKRYPEGNYLMGTEVSNADEDATIKALLDGEFDHDADRVYQLTDVTAEFRSKLQDRINRSEDGIIPDWLVWFMTEERKVT
jgi:hypothetical protein